MMESILQLWPLLLTIPFVCIGIVFLFFPEKAMRFFASFGNPYGMDDDELDNIPTIPGTNKWLLGGRSWSEFLRTMKERPEELRHRMIWFRIVGFAFLMAISLGFCLTAIVL